MLERSIPVPNKEIHLDLMKTNVSERPRFIRVLCTCGCVFGRLQTQHILLPEAAPPRTRQLLGAKLRIPVDQNRTG